MNVMFNMQWKNCSPDYWMEFSNRFKKVRSEFMREGGIGLVNEFEAMGYGEIFDQLGMENHSNDPQILSHIEEIQEKTLVYDLIDAGDNPEDYHLWFMHFTFENETPDQWIKTWLSDAQRPPRNEKFAIIDDNNVMVFFEADVTKTQMEAHVNRPEVAAHIAKVNERSRGWAARLRE
jgi:hypothetical protein